MKTSVTNGFRGRLLGMLLLIGLLLVGAADAMIKYLPLSDLYRDAELVCVATVGATKASGHDELWQLATTDVAVIKVLKGKPVTGTLRVETRVFDGPIEDPPAVFGPGAKEVIVFLRSTGSTAPGAATHVLSNLHQGIMSKDELGAAWDTILKQLEAGGKE